MTPIQEAAAVVVIGAGMAGVTAAREIARAGVSVIVVEAGDRIGGRVRTIRGSFGEPVEAGAEFVHGVRSATWPELRAAGLATRPCPLIRHTMFNVGGGTRWLPWILLHPGAWPAFGIVRSLARFVPPDISAQEFIERKRYRGRARSLAKMTLTAHLPGRATEIGVLGLREDGVLRLETGLNHRVAEGYDRLPQFIGRDLDVRFGFAVRTVRWGASGVTVCAADGRELRARVAICSLPLGVLKAGRVRFEPGLPENKRSALEDLVMGPVVKLLLRFEERFWPRWLANLGCSSGPVTLYWPISYRADSDSPVLIAYATGPRAARRRLAAADTGALLWAGSATVSSPIAETVEAAYLSGKRAAAEALPTLDG